MMHPADQPGEKSQRSAGRGCFVGSQRALDLARPPGDLRGAKQVVRGPSGSLNGITGEESGSLVNVGTKNEYSD